MKGSIMKLKLISVAMITVLSAGFNANAVDIDDVTMDIEKKEFKRGHKIKHNLGEIVRDFMLEQGDITQEEIDANKAEREAVREELKALKEAGDTEGLEARKAELKEQRQARREEVKAYIDGNDELKAELEEQKQAFREKAQERRENRKERRKERQEEVTEG